MTKIMVILLAGMLVSIQAFSVEFSMNFNTAAPGGSYAQKNCVAAWVTKSDGTFVKTLIRYGNTRKTSLTTWYAVAGAADADAYMGATRANHFSPAPMTATWNLRDKAGNVVPDGTYIIKLECADGSRQAYSFNFVKDSTAGTRTAAGNTYFKNISIAYAPPAPPNTAPVAQAQSVTNIEDTAKAITLTATDAESNPLTYAIAASPAHGTISGSAPNVTYSPATNYYGTDSFTFTASDASLISTPATVSITVTPVNDAPVSQSQSVSAIDGNPVSITLVAIDAETNAITYSLLSQPATGHLLGVPPSLTYVPVRGMSGSDSFAFNATDGMATGNTATVSLTLVFIDSSNNGIPNSWQSQYGITDAAADPDGDGASNYAEYMAGTNPTNKTSVFAVNVPQMTGGSNVLIKWSSVPYRFYSVLSATNLTGGWSTLVSNSMATPPLNSYTGTVNQTGPTFYRIRLDP